MTLALEQHDSWTLAIDDNPPPSSQSCRLFQNPFPPFHNFHLSTKWISGKKGEIQSCWMALADWKSVALSELAVWSSGIISKAVSNALTRSQMRVNICLLIGLAFQHVILGCKEEDRCKKNIRNTGNNFDEPCSYCWYHAQWYVSMLKICSSNLMIKCYGNATMRIQIQDKYILFLMA